MEPSNGAHELRLVGQHSAPGTAYDDFPHPDQPPPSSQGNWTVRIDTRDIPRVVLALAVLAAPVAMLVGWVVADSGRTRRANSLIDTFHPPKVFAPK